MGIASFTVIRTSSRQYRQFFVVDNRIVINDNLSLSFFCSLTINRLSFWRSLSRRCRLSYIGDICPLLTNVKSAMVSTVPPKLTVPLAAPFLRSIPQSASRVLCRAMIQDSESAASFECLLLGALSGRLLIALSNESCGQ